MITFNIRPLKLFLLIFLGIIFFAHSYGIALGEQYKWIATEKHEITANGYNSYSPTILYDQGVYKMWFGGYWSANKQEQDFDRISYAYSGDMVNWTFAPSIFGPIRIPGGCPQCANGVATYGVNDPSVIRSGSTLIMYFTAVHADVSDPLFGKNELWVAYSYDGENWFAATPVKNISISDLGSIPDIGVPSAVMINGRLYIYAQTYQTGTAVYRILMKDWETAESYVPTTTKLLEIVNGPDNKLTALDYRTPPELAYTTWKDYHLSYFESTGGINWSPETVLADNSEFPYDPSVASFAIPSTSTMFWIDKDTFWAFPVMDGSHPKDQPIQDMRFKIYAWKYKLTAICKNECNNGAKQCSGNGYQKCGDANGDGCLEWGSVAACASGQSCSGGTCVSTCAPKTCGQLNYSCGTAADGCGGTLYCGDCGSAQTCSNGACVSSPTCVPHTCSFLGYECGGVSNGCGNMLNCGACNSGNICSGGTCIADASLTKPVAKMTRAEILAAIAQIQALIADLQKQLAALTEFSCASITKNLFYGMTNDPQVKCLQDVLKSQGFAVVPTGTFGSITKAAVIQFQEKYAREILTPYGLKYGSGNVGNATKNKINQIIGGK